MTPDASILDVFDTEIMRLGGFDFDHLMNHPDEIAHEFADKGQVRITFHRYGMAIDAPEGGPITTGFRISAGNQDAIIGKDPSYSGELEYWLEYARHAPMRIQKRNIEISQDWFLQWLQNNLHNVVNNVIERNERYWKADNNYQEAIALDKEIERKTFPRDAIGSIIGAVIGGAGVQNLFGAVYLTIIGAFFSGYAGYLLVKQFFPIEGEEK